MKSSRLLVKNDTDMLFDNQKNRCNSGNIDKKKK